MRLLLAFLLCSAAPAATVLRVAVGGPGGVDPAGNTWAPDSGICGGSAWVNTPSAGLNPPYLNLRYATAFTCQIPLLGGSYVVTLKFIEPNKTGAGQRVFSVSTPATQPIVNMDLFQVAGMLKPYDQTFAVTVGTAGLTLSFSASAGNAVLSGIQIDSSPAGGIVSSQLLDFGVVYTSPSVLTFGASCSPSTPCLAGPLNTSYTVPFTVTLTGGSGVAFVYLDLAGNISVAPTAGLTLACSLGCLTPAGLTTWPDGSEKLWSCTATNGVWDPNGCTDRRTFLGAPRLLPAGLNLGMGFLSALKAGPIAPGGTVTVSTPEHGIVGQCIVFSVGIWQPDATGNLAAVGSGFSYNRNTCDVILGPFPAGLSNFYVSILGMHSVQ